MQYEGDLGFQIVAPDYIPPGTNPVPFPDLVKEGEIAYSFNPRERDDQPLEKRPRVEVTQRRAKNETPVDTPPVLPSLFPSNRETLVIEGHDVVLFRSVGQAGASMAMHVTSGGFQFSVVVSWASPEPSEGSTVITPEMEEEAWKVLRSLLRS
jgi:hypothetical protein